MSKSKPSTIKYKSSYELNYPWVAADPKINTNALCIWCKATINISSMGRTALESHMKSKKHQQIVATREKSQPMELFVKKKVYGDCEQKKSMQGLQIGESSDATTLLGNGSNLTQSTPEKGYSKKRAMQRFFLSEDVTKTEILWCLQTVMSHLSIRSSASCASIFPLMFTDSQIAEKVKLQRTKLAYSIVYGIAPYFQRALLKSIDQCNTVVLEFDESLNSVSQKTQMDVHIRFWDEEKSLISTRFFGSVFIQRSRAIDLLDAIVECFGRQNLGKILQLSMDGPNVNLKVLTDLNSEIRQTCDGKELLNIGVCSLHVVHGAFKTGMLKTKWNIVPILKAAYYLFNNAPARKAQYTEYTNSSVFPKSFCGTRWVENVEVADILFSILPHLKKYVSQAIEKNTAPTSQSFNTIAEAVEDEFLGVKLAFFSATANLLEPFLHEYQTDHPMAPFLYDDLFAMITTLMQRVVKPEILKNTSLSKIDLTDKNNLIAAKNFDLDFASKDALKKVKGANELEVLRLKDQMRCCNIVIVEKLWGRSPLKYSLTRAISCLNPRIALTTYAQRRLTSALEILVSNGRISGVSADRVKQEYVHLCNEAQIKELLKSFGKGITRLDKFWVDAAKLSSIPCDNFLNFMKLILILSHGNAAVERGFSVNSECLVENQHEKSLIAQRRIYDGISDAGGLEKFDINKSLIHSMRNAHSLFKEDKVNRLAETERQNERELLKRHKKREICELETKRAKCLADAAKLTADIEKSITDLKNS